jgi:transcription elongation factor S-II
MSKSSSMSSIPKIENPEKFRINITSKINQKLNNDKYSRNLERGIYNWALKEADSRKIIKKWENPLFVLIYLDRLRTIIFNLNEDIIDNIQKGIVKPQIIAFMTHQELKPSKWDLLIQEKMKKDKYKYENNIQASTDTFTCKKCHSNNCTYYQMQTRSADEPMTTFVTCIDCGKRWKC